MIDRVTRYLVPVSGLLGVVTLASLLIFQIVWRPWSDTNRSWETHLNVQLQVGWRPWSIIDWGGETQPDVQAAVPPDYARTPVAYVGNAGDMRDAWEPDPAALAREPKGRVLYVAKGCASCHGLEARGGLVGPALAGIGADAMRRQLRTPVGQMPVYSAKDLPDQELAEIARYLNGLTAPVPVAQGPAGRNLYMAKGCAGCHGLEAQGGPVGPAVAGVGVSEVLKQVRTPQGRMPAYPEKNLTDQELEEIARYLGGLSRRRTPSPTENRR